MFSVPDHFPAPLFQSAEAARKRQFSGSVIADDSDNAAHESITEILTELQNEVEQFNSYGTPFRISYSHRLALSTDYNECTLRTLFDKADKYMYENKQQSKQGRQD